MDPRIVEELEQSGGICRFNFADANGRAGNDGDLVPPVGRFELNHSWNAAAKKQSARHGGMTEFPCKSAMPDVAVVHFGSWAVTPEQFCHQGEGSGRRLRNFTIRSMIARGSAGLGR